MSTAALTTIALSTPVLFSNAIFSYRRTARGIDAADENPLFAAANFTIAGAQILKGAKASAEIAKSVNPNIEAFEAIKKISNSNKVVKGCGTVLEKTGKYINPVIVGASAIKVLGSDDKLDAAARESTRLLCMFGAESLTKAALGMPFTKNINGKDILCNRKGFIEKNASKCIDNLFNQSQSKAIKDAANMKFLLNRLPENVAKALPGAIKGVLFAVASILGYKLGDVIATKILGKEKKSN